MRCEVMINAMSARYVFALPKYEVPGPKSQDHLPDTSLSSSGHCQVDLQSSFTIQSASTPWT